MASSLRGQRQKARGATAAGSRGNRRDCSLAWLGALQEATGCLRSSYQKDNGAIMLDHSLAYLDHLENIIRRQQEHRWGRVPNRNPPKFVVAATGNHHEGKENNYTSGGGNYHHQHQQQQQQQRNQNPFATFQDDSDDDESSSSSSSNNSTVSEDDEAGDTPILNQQKSTATPTVNTESMDWRRVLIRVMTAQSDMYAARATGFREQHQWLQGAEQYAWSLQKIHAALELADTEVSQWIAAGHQTSQTLVKLMQDADIVQVAVQYLTQEHERYLKAAQHRERYLKRKLQPQWQSRDQVKERLGDKWFNNPEAKHDYSTLRRDQEEQLQDVQSAVERLVQLQSDTTQAEVHTQRLKHRLEDPTAAPTEENDTTSNQQQQERYNGKRPSPALQARRLDPQMYPDPSMFGWTFTGSCGAAEFFEKEMKGSDLMSTNNDMVVVKLDWYFTTGTVKTSLDHPTQGKTQLFGAQVNPTVYREILEHPRSHTGERYHERRERRSGGRGRGRGGGGDGRGRDGHRHGRGRGRGRGGGGRGRGERDTN